MRTKDIQISQNELMRIIQQIDKEDARPDLAESWLRLAGCKNVFHISSYTGDAIVSLSNHLKENGDVMHWEKQKV